MTGNRMYRLNFRLLLSLTIATHMETDTHTTVPLLYSATEVVMQLSISTAVQSRVNSREFSNDMTI